MKTNEEIKQILVTTVTMRAMARPLVTKSMDGFTIAFSNGAYTVYRGIGYNAPIKIEDLSMSDLADLIERPLPQNEATNLINDFIEKSQKKPMPSVSVVPVEF